MSATTSPNHTDATGQVLMEAGRRMLPVLAARLGAAAADRAEEGIDRLADRLDDLAEHGFSRGGDDAATDDGGVDEDGDGGESGGLLSRLVQAVITQARALLDLLVKLVAQAAAAARSAAGKLRAQRAPEGIDAEDDGTGELEPADADRATAGA